MLAVCHNQLQKYAGHDHRDTSCLDHFVEVADIRFAELHHLRLNQSDHDEEVP